MSKDPKTAASISNADKVLDALGEVERPARAKYACLDCGSTRHTTRRALGGPLIRVCLDCGSKQVTGSGRGMHPLINAGHNQGTGRGPVATSLNKTKKHKPSNQPSFRGKGKKRE